jgi:hypothetical protein
MALLQLGQRQKQCCRFDGQSIFLLDLLAQRNCRLIPAIQAGQDEVEQEISCP